MVTKKHRLLLGAHMSIAGGIEKSIERGQLIGCTTIQIFTKSNRQWHAKKLTPQQIDLFKKTAVSSSVHPIVAHASYLINIASPEKKTALASVNALIKELEVCNELGIPYLVLHPGSFVTGTPEEGLDRSLANLDHVLSINKGDAVIALEIMAGQGSSLCTSFEQLGYLLKHATHKKRLGICFDTCHAFAAGYTFSTPKDYEAMWKSFDKTIGLQHLKVIHINDSKMGFSSGIDRHEHIGKGKIGLEGFRLLFNDPRFFDTPKILETPKATKEPFTEDIKNMKTVRSLLSAKTRNILHVKEEE